MVILSALTALLTPGTLPDLQAFRVTPYLLNPHRDTVVLNWFTHKSANATVTLRAQGSPPRQLETKPQTNPFLGYHEIEEQQRAEFPDMETEGNFKHSVTLDKLKPDTRYSYEVKVGSSIYTNSFRTPPAPTSDKSFTIVAFADSETDYDSRVTNRPWSVGTQHPDSTGRPSDRPNYLVTETQGFIENLKAIRQANPLVLMLAGDIVQGAGYQIAWDEFFYHTAGKFDDPLGSIPLIPAIGNWENFGARVGGYEPWAVHRARQKYKSYFDAPANNDRRYKNFYHRLDVGPVTIITLDSSNGLPDNTDNDTNKNIDAALYPGNDLTDLAPDSPQWKWCMAQLKDARSKGQLIIVQFHHVPYSSGGHSLPTTLADSSGQSGLAMRQYFPFFQQYGVAAVICGHNESFERSEVGGIQVYDVGIAGDGLGYAINDRDPRRINPWRKWVAHFDSAENWQGKKLIDGGKHYGHLEMNITPSKEGFKIEYVPVYIFPVTDDEGKVTRFERRVYNDQFTATYPRNRGPIKIPVPGPPGN